MDEMIREEQIGILIDQFTELQRIRKANGSFKNEELDYQIRIAGVKLKSLGVSVKNIEL